MVSRLWRRILSLHFCQEFVYLRAKTSKKPNQILRSTRAAFRALQRRSWTLLDLDSMYAEQDPRECSVEQADIDLGQIQVEALQLNLSTLKVYQMTRSTQPDTTKLLVGAPSQQRAMEQSRDVLRVLMFCKIFQACDARRLKHVRGATGWRQSWG